MDKAIYHVDLKSVERLIERNYPGIMKHIVPVRIAQDLEDDTALIMDFHYIHDQHDGMNYITAIVTLDPQQWFPVTLLLFERVTAPSS